jgi:transcriptional regulator with XRE-family HTH domain
MLTRNSSWTRFAQFAVTFPVRKDQIKISGGLPLPRALAAARALVGMSQRELATAAGLSTRSVAGYEAGLSMLRADNLGAIMGVLRQRGIRFLEESDDVAMGVLLLRGKRESDQDLHDQNLPKSNARTD